MTLSRKSEIFEYFKSERERKNLNSKAGGMAVARLYGCEVDFVRNPFSGSAAWFFIIILQFIFTPIFEIKIFAKNPLHQKNFIFEAPFS